MLDVHLETSSQLCLQNVPESKTSLWSCLYCFLPDPSYCAAFWSGTQESWAKVSITLINNGTPTIVSSLLLTGIADECKTLLTYFLSSYNHRQNCRQNNASEPGDNVVKWKRGIKVADQWTLSWRQYPQLSRGPHVIRDLTCNGGRQESENPFGKKDARSKTLRQPLEAGKGKATEFPVQFLEGTWACQYLDCSPV